MGSGTAQASSRANALNNKSRGRILLVEDDHEYRRTLARYLTRNGYEVREAENGLVARTILELNKDSVELVLSDIRMPELDGVALMECVRKYPTIKVILMTGFSDILESKQAFELGASDFLSKPFGKDDLFQAVDRCLHPPDPESVEESVESKFRGIPIDQFITSSHMISDVYVRLSEKKFIRVTCAGDKVRVDRLKVYQSKNVGQLYVRGEDFHKYLNFSLKLAQAAVASKRVSIGTKSQLYRHTTKVLVDQVCLDGVDRQTLSSAHQVVEDVVGAIMEDNSLLELMNCLSSRDDRLYAHSLAVSVLSTMIAKDHGWTAPPILFKVVLGALFHDVGKREIPPEVLSKPRVQLTAEEIRLIESHATRGRDILSLISSIPSEVALVAYHHHENQTGTGYPQGLSSNQISPIAKLVAVTDKFCSLAFPIQSEVQGMSVSEAMFRLMSFHSDSLDPVFLRRLQALFPDIKSEKTSR